VVWRFL